MTSPFNKYSIEADIAETAFEIYNQIKSKNSRNTWKRELFHGFCIYKAYESNGYAKTFREISAIVAYDEKKVSAFILKKNRPSVSGIYVKPVKRTLKDSVRSHCNNLDINSELPMLEYFITMFDGKIDFGDANLLIVAAGAISVYFLIYKRIDVTDYISDVLKYSSRTVSVHANAIVSYVYNIHPELFR